MGNLGILMRGLYPELGLGVPPIKPERMPFITRPGIALPAPSRYSRG